MKTLTVKLPEPLFFEIANQAKARSISKSDVVRERLARNSVLSSKGGSGSLWDRMQDVVVDSHALPRDLSANKKHLRTYGKNHPHR